MKLIILGAACIAIYFTSIWLRRKLKLKAQNTSNRNAKIGLECVALGLAVISPLAIVIFVLAIAG